jgi:hypothetical protein
MGEDYFDQLEQYEDLADRLGFGETRPHKPSGKKGRKTIDAIRSEAREKTTETEINRLKSEIAKVLGRIDEEKVGQYVLWVKNSLLDNETELPTEELERTATASGHGAGGQNRNKVATTVRYVHPITGIFAVCSEERTQSANEKIALTNLLQRLDAHIKAWKDLLKISPEGTTLDSLIVEIRSSSQK